MITKEDIEEFETRMSKYSSCCGECDDFYAAFSIAVEELKEMAGMTEA